MNTISVTDLKQNTAQVLKKIKSVGKPTVILQRSQAAAVLIDPEYYSILEQALEDLVDIQSIEERKNESLVSFKDVAKKIQK